LKKNKLNTLILEHSDYSEIAIDTYKKLGHIQYYDKSFNDYENINNLVIRLNYILDEEFLKKFRNLKYIISPTTGINHIDINYLKSINIKLIHLDTELHADFLKTITATAELTFGLILNLSRNIIHAVRSVENNEWNRDNHKGIELSGKTLGIIGLGRLGYQLAKYANVFGMKINAYDIKNKKNDSANFINHCSLDELLSKSDFVSLNINYSKENDKFFDIAKFHKMKSSSYFINTSRGECVDEEDLLKALNGNVIRGAALDVINNEDFNKKSLKERRVFDYLKKNKNLLITPHIGGCTEDSMLKTEKYLAEYFYKTIEVKK
jgi:D-3-phosphoglycerate dehydrogenase / 2-oxoglutarate reductase